MAESPTNTEFSEERRMTVAYRLIGAFFKKLSANDSFKRSLVGRYFTDGQGEKNEFPVWFNVGNNLCSVNYSSGPKGNTLEFREMITLHNGNRDWLIRILCEDYAPREAGFSYSDSKFPQNSSGNDQATVEKFNELLNRI